MKLVSAFGDNQKPRKDTVTNVSNQHVTSLLHSLMGDDHGKDVTIISSEGEYVRYGHFCHFISCYFTELNMRLVKGEFQRFPMRNYIYFMAKIEIPTRIPKKILVSLFSGIIIVNSGILHCSKDFI